MALGYVRPARESDAPQIASIQLSTWRTAYAKFIPAEVLDNLDHEWFTQQWREACTNPPSTEQQVFVAIEQDETDKDRLETVGFAAVGPDTEEETGNGLVTELLVEPRFGRRGHGSRLLSAAVAHWRAHGILLARAWAFARDNASLNFYRAAGWETDGASRTLEMEATMVPQLRLHADLTEDD